MSSERKLRPPAVCRLLVHIASWLAPSRTRTEWRERWDASLWNWWILFERGELTNRDYAELLKFSWGSFLDAFWLRFSRQELRHLVRGPALILLSGALALLAIGLSSHGFRRTRALFDPLPLQDPGSLVSVRYMGAANEPFGVPPRLIPLWRSKSQLLTGLAGYMRPRGLPRAWVTADFFTLLGVRPELGRTLRPGDVDVAVLSGNAWRSMYERDRGVIGRTIELEGKRFTIVGVLPDSFWAISPSIDVWTPLRLEPPEPGVPFLIGAVGRLSPGASRDRVRTELFQIAREAHQFVPRPPLVTSFGSIPSHPYAPYLFGFLFAAASGVVLVIKAVPLPSGHGWRYWSYFCLKTIFAITIPTLLWVEGSRAISGAIPFAPLRLVVTGLLAPLAYLVAFAFALWWSFADQRVRCPMCLQLLGMPVTLGSWGSVLEPSSTELLCDSGHGSLYSRDDAGGQTDRWTDLDPSWRELFGGK